MKIVLKIAIALNSLFLVIAGDAQEQDNLFDKGFQKFVAFLLLARTNTYHGLCQIMHFKDP